LLGLALAYGSVVGCGSDARVQNEPTPDLPVSPVLTERSDRGQRLPSPDVAEITFDTSTNVLKLYELPASARWMVLLPHDKAAVPVDREYKMPEGVDADKTFIYYAVPAGRQSKLVTLTEVQQAGEQLSSRGP